MRFPYRYVSGHFVSIARFLINFEKSYTFFTWYLLKKGGKSFITRTVDRVILWNCTRKNTQKAGDLQGGDFYFAGYRIYLMIRRNAYGT